MKVPSFARTRNRLYESKDSRRSSWSRENERGETDGPGRRAAI